MQTEVLNEYQRAAAQDRSDRLVLSHLPLVKHIIGRLIGTLPSGTDLENLESAGVLGLVEAAAKFDPGRNTQFKTFAYLRIKGAILDELRRNSAFPQQALKRMAAIRHAANSLPPPVAIADLARESGLTEDEVADTLAAMRFQRMKSWELASRSEETGPASPERSPDETVSLSEQIGLLTDAIEALPERQRLLVTLYYREDLRLKEISTIVGLSPSRISRLLTAALLQLRECIRVRSHPAADRLLAAMDEGPCFA